MRVEIANRCENFTSYRAARVKSLFNAEDGSRFDLTADLPIEEPGWAVGVVVGPSGSGKSSIGRELVARAGFAAPEDKWTDGPIVDGIAPDGDFNAVTGALGQVGLGDVPAWLRPYAVLSTGQQFRADLARVIAEAPDAVVIDEFTSVVDRQIAKIGAGAFAKAWRRTGGRAVLLTCHYDVLEWLEPDWIFDTATGELARGSHHRPRLDLEIRQGGWQLWPLFKPHHYLDSGPMPAAKAYVGFIDGEPVSHLGIATRPVNTRRGLAVEARGCRMVVMPEWQGAGVGTKFLNYVCELQRTGEGVLPRRMTTIFHTSHPQLCAALRRDRRWRQVSAVLHGSNKGKSQRTMARAGSAIAAGYGGHFRAVQGFRYVGERAA